MSNVRSKEWLGLPQVAAELDIPIRSLYNQRSRGVGVKGYRIGKHVRVRREDLDAWLEEHADRPRALDGRPAA